MMLLWVLSPFNGAVCMSLAGSLLAGTLENVVRDSEVIHAGQVYSGAFEVRKNAIPNAGPTALGVSNAVPKGVVTIETVNCTV